MNPDPVKATQLKPGVTLLTRDGRIMGNAIVLYPAGHTSSFPGSRDYIQLWLIETDFGNRTKLSTKEIEERFYLGFERTYQEWFFDRLEAIGKSSSS